MKDVTRNAPAKTLGSNKDLVCAAAWQVLSAITGLIASRAVIADRLVPFGLSLIAGIPAVYAPAAATGVFLGYFVTPVESGTFRYTTAVLAIIALRLLASLSEKLSKNRLLPTAICLFSSLLTSFLTLGLFNPEITDIFADACLAAGGAYFISSFFKDYSEISVCLSADGLVSLFAFLGIMLTGLHPFTYGGISVGHIAALALILTAAKYGGVLSGAVSGVTAALSLVFSGAAGETAVIYAFTGVLAGVFSTFGKYAVTAVPLFFGLAAAALKMSALQSALCAVEAILGAALFLAIPRKAGIYLGKLFAARPKLAIPGGIKKSLEMRLDMAANALGDVSETVEQVAAELSKINAPDFGTVISAVEQDACAGCKLRLHCWESRRDDTVTAILEITKAIKSGSTEPAAYAPEEFRGRCMRQSSVANSVYKRYSDYTSRIAAENRIDEVRSVVSDQFEGISDMLYDLARDIETDTHYDNSAAEKAAAALKNLNIQVEECSSRTDKFGRIKIELKVKKSTAPVINKLQIMKLVSVVCERDFDVPAVNETGGDIFITLSEHAALRVDVGVEQRCASDSMMCGDAYKYFFDGHGHFITVLSDGMGTGGRAAVDGAMASGLMCRLLKAGFGFDCSLKILNSSMLFKSTDESLATVDIASIDLYNGQVELYKAGAAPTVIRRSGKTGRAESTSLPAGILRDVRFDKATVKCREGDIVVMMSDGAAFEGCDWIRAELEKWQGGTAQELSERLCEGAHRRRSDNHEDDITVITAVLKKSV